ncbi:hypothetical protein K435DRAFT_798754 [Dendrothele bispora CBS 962.96]|uniref:Uncharacterized protein n=1 Tax=Dendrothele bispora (strain CBS 962.96) TaxID=1314807 RepID=A0A4V4HFE2_DENBC|nr:hypothetical protein K435DRAFT_798754 [Dendrothele bispora CBS 962.96]
MSALDWHIARWAGEEGISQKALDRFLKIPKASYFEGNFSTDAKEQLGLSFHNSQEMMKKVDEIPECCGKWSTKRLRFKDSPNEWYTIRHWDPVEVIKGLWGDPAFSDLLEFKPKKVFLDDIYG